MGVRGNATDALVRAIEAAVTFFLVTFVVTAAGLLSAVDLTNTKAVKTALISALVGAAVGALKELSGLSFLNVTGVSPPAP